MTHVLQVLFLSVFILQVVMHGEESQDTCSQCKSIHLTSIFFFFQLILFFRYLYYIV